MSIFKTNNVYYYLKKQEFLQICGFGLEGEWWLKTGPRGRTAGIRCWGESPWLDRGAQSKPPATSKQLH